MRPFYFIAALCSVALSCAPVATQAPPFHTENATYTEAATSTMIADTPLPPRLNFSRTDAIQDIAKARPAGVSVNFGQVVQLKAFYFEKQEPIARLFRVMVY
jgi:hypothetical protein